MGTEVRGLSELAEARRLDKDEHGHGSDPHGGGRIKTEKEHIAKVVPGTSMRTAHGAVFHATITQAGHPHEGKTIAMEKKSAWGKAHYSANQGDTWHQSARDAIDRATKDGALFFPSRANKP